MRGFVRRLGRGRFWALALKELRQIGRDRRLTLSLIVPPTLQMLLFGFALNPEVQNLRLGILDESRTPESRDLVSTLTENRTFRLAGSYPTEAALEAAIAGGDLDVGVVVPYHFGRGLARGQPVTVQVLVNAVNANTGQIAQGYVEAAVAWYAQTRRAQAPRAAGEVTIGQRAADVPAPAPSRAPAAAVVTRTTFLYNPGLVSTWFIATGLLGTLITLNGSLVAAATMIREKERGTVEQLLMTPASALEVVAAKMVPLFVLLMGMTGLALTLARLVFRVPFRGSPLLLLTACGFCVLTGIGIGTMVSTLARSATQAQLMMFFINPPLTVLSGAMTPIEAMPRWVQPLTAFNPIAHFTQIARNVMVKGAATAVVAPHLGALALFAAALLCASAWRFRRQLA